MITNERFNRIAPTYSISVVPITALLFQTHNIRIPEF